MASSAEAEHRGEEEETTGAAVEDEATGAQIAPIVKLEEVVVAAGEEDEDAIFDLSSIIEKGPSAPSVAATITGKTSYGVARDAAVASENVMRVHGGPKGFADGIWTMGSYLQQVSFAGGPKGFADGISRYSYNDTNFSPRLWSFYANA